MKSSLMPIEKKRVQTIVYSWADYSLKLPLRDRNIFQISIGTFFLGLGRKMIYNQFISGYSCTAPAGDPHNHPDVIPVVVGSYHELSKNPLMIEMNGSITLIKIQKRNILIDTGTIAMKDNILNALRMLGNLK